MRKLMFFLLMELTIGCVWAADQVTLTAEAPDVVVSGDQFRLSFTVNSQKGKDFRLPSIKGFEVLMGPSRSVSSRTYIDNGKVSSSSSVTFTYILMAGEAGTYTVPAASIEMDNEKVFSNALTIKVLPKDQADEGSRPATGNVSRSQSAGGRIAANDFFFTTTASKTRVHEQEALLLTYKVYTTLDLRQLLGNISDLKGFHSQEIDLPTQKEWRLEHYKGRNYKTIVWRQFVLFPQQTGKLEIPSVEFEGIIAQRVQTSDDPFDAFFNGGGVVEVKKKIQTPKVTIQVDPLPAKPAGFSGAVGQFTLTSSISAKEVKTNDAVTLKLAIAGSGNLKLIGTPDVKFPEDFEVYDPKVSNNFKVTSAGVNGSKNIEYLVIPRHAGDFTIPPVEFTYFDVQANAYKTLKTEAYAVKVNKGQGNAGQVIADFTSKENVKVIGQDIRFIKMGETSYSRKGDFFFGTAAYWAAYLVPFLLFAAVVIVCRKQAKENVNIARVKTKKANKVAARRMKVAAKLLADNQKNEFYDEVLKALWGYISDKLNMPVSQLSKDNIEAELTGHGVSAELIQEFIRALNECEFARYAPGDQNEAMDKVYAASVEVISKMENSIKRN
ncbi:MAG: BatD family protein [Bacteroidales bacterium]|nr:BatD family protein [Bacteroidales bacterium]